MRNIKKSCAGRGHRHEVAGVWGGAQRGEAGGGWVPVAWHLRGEDKQEPVQGRRRE